VKLVNASLRVGIANDTDRFAWAFPCAGVRLCSLSSHGQSSQVSNAPVALDGLQSFEVEALFSPQVTLDNMFAFLDGVDDLGQLIFTQIFGSQRGLNASLARISFELTGPIPYMYRKAISTRFSPGISTPRIRGIIENSIRIALFS
jgi:hypothetical protein